MPCFKLQYTLQSQHTLASTAFFVRFAGTFVHRLRGRGLGFDLGLGYGAIQSKILIQPSLETVDAALSLVKWTVVFPHFLIYFDSLTASSKT